LFLPRGSGAATSGLRHRELSEPLAKDSGQEKRVSFDKEADKTYELTACDWEVVAARASAGGMCGLSLIRAEKSLGING